MTPLVMAAVAAVPWQSLDAGARAERQQLVRGEPIERRLLSASEGFLGTWYAVSPLGEGQGVDPDPLIRFDAVDCLTMVEQSMALALAPAEPEVVETLSRIRYGHSAVYEDRLHVMESQWIPENLKKGVIEDVTRTLGGPATRTVTKRITEATWAEKSGQSLHLPPSAQVKGEFRLEVIPVDLASSVLSSAPAGLIVVVVRADRPRLISRITHVGILVQKPSGPHLRHASRTFKKVVDEPIERYLRRNLEFGAWTVEGVALFRLTEPSWAMPKKMENVAPNEAEANGDTRTDAGAQAVQSPGVSAVPRAASGSTKCGCESNTNSLLLGGFLVLRRRPERVKRVLWSRGR